MSYEVAQEEIDRAVTYFLARGPKSFQLAEIMSAPSSSTFQDSTSHADIKQAKSQAKDTES
jgi:hypothetical protein